MKWGKYELGHAFETNSKGKKSRVIPMAIGKKFKIGSFFSF
jgi:hypothetical protein